MNYSEPDVSKGNLLIVDDTPNNLHLLSSMLEELGYEVRCANSGTMALMAIHTESPDLVLLDIHMPEMDGYEVCTRLKANPQTCDIPVIFLSALNETFNKVQAFKLGGVDYITKPFQVEEVLVRLETQLKLRRMQQKLQLAEAEARQALAQEQELNRLKSEFVSMISHDFRTPLTVIQAFAGLLQVGDRPPERSTIEYYVSKIDTAVSHLLDLLDEILLIGQLEVGKARYQPTPLNLQGFCQKLLETLQMSTQYPHLEFTLTDPDTDAEMDAMLLQQILTNLLSNAIKYSPTQGHIFLNVHCQASQVIFQVRDQGIGIPQENQAKLFEAFYRCSNVGAIKGTGLGLAVVKRCVDAHDGRIEFESSEGMGTTFTVTLPRYPQMVEANSEGDRASTLLA